jgi:hypothetical protein
VGLVDDEQRGPALAEPGQRPVVGELLGREEEELDVAGLEGLDRRLPLAGGDRGVQRGGGQAELGQGLELVLLERDER